METWLAIHHILRAAEKGKLHKSGGFSQTCKSCFKNWAEVASLRLSTLHVANLFAEYNT